jgi:isopropylmalate/homocitrate/citramalate synthase
MLTKIMQPMSAKSFRRWLLSNEKFNKFYNEMGKPLLFDVTLRDGLQALSKDEQNEFTINKKLEIYKEIILRHKPENIEIGSIVSEKVLPIFKDTLQFFETINNYKNETLTEPPNHFILVPNKDKLKTIIDNNNINCLSFITSVSNSFQLKNTKMNLEQSDQEIYEMLYELDENVVRTKKPIVKLYVSCINECPIEGKLDNDFIVNRILTLSKMNVENICLSDTCGTITTEDFEYIIESCLFFGLAPSKLSLHLHVKNERKNEVESLIHKALEFKINKFDVSYLKTGGCSLTIDAKNLAPNLSYDLYYKSLVSYIEKNLKSKI